MIIKKSERILRKEKEKERIEKIEKKKIIELKWKIKKKKRDVELNGRWFEEEIEGILKSGGRIIKRKKGIIEKRVIEDKIRMLKRVKRMEGKKKGIERKGKEKKEMEGINKGKRKFDFRDKKGRRLVRFDNNIKKS